LGRPRRSALRAGRRFLPGGLILWIQSSLETSDLVERILGHLAEYLQGRPDTIQLDTTGLTIDQTYVRLTTLLDT